MAGRAEQLRLLAEEAETLGQPGARALLARARKKGWDQIKAQDVRDLIALQGKKAVLRPLNESKGKTATAEMGTRCQMDLIDYRTRRAQGFSVVLVIIDQFSRKLWAAPVSGKDPASVRPVLEKLLDDFKGGNGGKEVALLASDAGNEFTGPVAQLLADRGIAHRVDIGKYDRNAHALLDRAIQELKKRITRMTMGPGNKTWVDVLPQSVNAHNSLDSQAIHGNPDGMSKNTVQEFLTTQDNARAFKHNKELAERRADTLREKGAFRQPIGPVTKFARGFNAQWSEKLDLARVEGDMAVATDGTRVATKLVQAVDKRQSNETPRVEINEQQIAKRMEVLEPLVQTIRELMPEGRRMALTVLGRRLNEVDPDWRDTYLRPLRMGSKGAPGAGALRSIMELFPEVFTLGGEGTQQNMYVSLTS